MSDAAPDVERLVRELNRTWVERRYDDLDRFFDDEVVLLAAGSGAVLVGVGPMVESYRQFGALGTVHEFEVQTVDLYPRGAVVMAHMRFVIDYELPTGRFTETGFEVYAVDVTRAEPKIVWRHQLRLGEPEP